MSIGYEDSNATSIQNIPVDPTPPTEGQVYKYNSSTGEFEPGNSGDSFFLGYYDTEAALNAAYPTADDGNYAIVGFTDTVWVWDDGTSAWVDSGTAGSVTSVFGRTGVVVAESGDYSYTEVTNALGTPDIGVSVQGYNGNLEDLSSLATTKGDIAVFNGSNWTRLGAGSNGQILTADDTATTGLDWDNPAGGGDMLASVYDPEGVEADAFDMDNMAQGDTNKFLSADELTVVQATSGSNTGDQVGDGVTITGAGTVADPFVATGSGDMAKAVYDPASVEGDAFDMDNMAQGTTNKFLSSAELADVQALDTAAYEPTSSFQAANANLTSLAGLTPASSLVIGDGLGGFESKTPANFITDNNILDTADIGSSVQAYDANNATASSTTTFTNKTIDANGTGNSISNLETADFAANVVDTDVTLTANSDTRLASQKAIKAYVDSMPSGISIYTATVATSDADYTTVKAAYDAGHTAIDVIGDTTETASTALTTDLNLRIRPNATLTMGAYNFTAASAVEIWIDWYGTIDYTQTVASTELFDVASGSQLYVEGYSSGVFDNNSTQDGCSLITLNSATDVYVKNFSMQLPSKNNCGVVVNASSESYAENIQIQGGGSLCRGCLTGFRKVDGLLLEGTFTSSTTSDPVLNNQHTTNLWADATAEIQIFVDSNGTLSNFGTFNPANGINIYLGGDNDCSISNGYIGSDATIDFGNRDGHKLTNVQGGVLDLSDSGCTYCQISNCEFTSITSNIINGDDHMFSNTLITTGFAVAGDRNQFNGGRVGATGGSNTITINAGATNNVINNVMVDADVVDGGTTSSVSFKTV